MTFRDSPDHETTGWPPGVPYIVGNEGCERFSYYGMRSILYIYMAEQLYRHHPTFGARAEDYATSHYHLFTAGVYLFPMIGAIIADRLLGKYRTIMHLSMVYCLGHLVLAVAEGSLYGLWLGLLLIAVGSGGIKPCVSAHVGDQFGRGNWFRLRAVYQAFYFMINLGSTLSFLVIPWVFEWQRTKTGWLAEHAVSIAFGIPGVLMLIATGVFWMGRNVFIHVPARPGGKLGLLDTLSSISLFMVVGHLFFTSDLAWPWLAIASVGFLVLGLGIFVVRQRIESDGGFLAVMLWSAYRFVLGPNQAPAAAESDVSGAHSVTRSRFFAPAAERFGVDAAEGSLAVVKIVSVFFLVSIFWALFDQSGSSWVRQAKMMDPRIWGEFEALPAQIQATNPIMVMLLIPISNYAIYPSIERLGLKMTALRRMTAGMVIAALSFVAVALIQIRIEDQGEGTVSILWQLIPYAIITLAEVLVSITGLEFAYSQAPKRMKSTIMGFWLLTVALGNLLVSFLARFGKLPLVQFFWVFAGLMLLAGVMFGIRAYFYEERDYVQE